jgi:toxin-antitoxin system PIN domain toxin
VILVDTNVLVYAIDRDSPSHQRAREWLERAFSGGELIGLSWIVLIGFLRIVTRPGIVAQPLAAAAALDYVGEWLQLRPVRIVEATTAHWGVLSALVRDLGTAGNLTNDAHLAALAIEHGAKICSTDRDFLRFPGITLINPLAADA